MKSACVNRPQKHLDHGQHGSYENQMSDRSSRFLQYLELCGLARAIQIRGPGRVPRPLSLHSLNRFTPWVPYSRAVCEGGKEDVDQSRFGLVFADRSNVYVVQKCCRRYRFPTLRIRRDERSGAPKVWVGQRKDLKKYHDGKAWATCPILAVLLWAWWRRTFPSCRYLAEHPRNAIDARIRHQPLASR